VNSESSFIYHVKMNTLKGVINKRLSTVTLISHVKRYCPANSKRGRYYAQIIRAGKLEAYPFFFLNFKGTPSQGSKKPFSAA
jgi:hypothetical protein